MKKGYNNNVSTNGNKLGLALDIVLLVLSLVYGLYALLAIFSKNAYLAHAGLLFVVYTCTVFASYMEKKGSFDKLWTLIAYGIFTYGITVGLIGYAVAAIIAIAVVAFFSFNVKHRDTYFITGSLVGYWLILFISSCFDIGHEVAPNVVNNSIWGAIIHAFTYAAVDHYVLSWKLIFIPLVGIGFNWLTHLRTSKNVKSHVSYEIDGKTKSELSYEAVNRQHNIQGQSHVQAMAAQARAEKAATLEEHQPTEPQSKQDNNHDRVQVLEQAIQQLKGMVGLSELKAEINSFMKQLEGQKKAEKLGRIKITKPTLHMVFAGPPGTGKTVVARLMADILYGLELIQTRNVIEADRSTIVGTHIGQTGENMSRLLHGAHQGVLFIDEAYALASEQGSNDFGREAIDILIKAMEDRRESLVVILAGYQADMERLMEMNEGFKSRIPFKFHFTDYTPAELSAIVLNMLQDHGYDCSEIKGELDKVTSFLFKSGSVIGNGRWARNFVDRVIKEHNLRIASDDQNIGKIMLDDLHSAAGVKKKSNTNAEDELAREGKRKLKEEALRELNNMIGLYSVKEQFKRFANFVEIEKRRMDEGVTFEKMSMHMIFAGPPGTGKTTIARIVGKFLNGAELVSNGHVIEADRSTIIGKYIGHTEANMKALIAKAKGGILFIDEAYALAKTYENSDFGKEAIDVLVKAMEDGRSDLIVILAGYEHEMKSLLALNPGLESRIPFKLQFPDYSAEEIVEIVMASIQAKHLKLTSEAATHLHGLVHFMSSQSGGVLNGNGRWARNLVEKLRMEQNNRVARNGSKDLMTIEAVDVKNVAKELMV